MYNKIYHKLNQFKTFCIHLLKLIENYTIYVKITKYILLLDGLPYQKGWVNLLQNFFNNNFWKLDHFTSTEKNNYETH